MLYPQIRKLVEPDLLTPAATHSPPVLDHYAILGVSRNATPHDIDEGARRSIEAVRAAMSARDPRAAERFAQLRIAMDVMRDPIRRAAYDTEILAERMKLEDTAQESAPNEEPPSPRGRKAVVLAVSVAFVLAGGFAFDSYVRHAYPDTPAATVSTTSPTTPSMLVSDQAQAISQPRTPSEPYWDYTTEPDKMTGKRATYATLRSSNSLDFDFPYQGQNYGQISVQSRPRQGTDVLFSVKKGQITCSPYECNILVRFDNDAPMRFGGTHPSDGSSEHVFLRNGDRFINRAKSARKIFVEFTAYHQGINVLEFAPATPLVWPQP